MNSDFIKIDASAVERAFLGIPEPQNPMTLDDYLPNIVGRIRVYLMVAAERRISNGV